MDPAGRAPLRRARLALWCEQAVPALAPAAGLLGLGLIAGLLDLARFLPGWLHALLLALWGGGVAALLIRGARRLRRPNAAAVLQRIETASGLPHRPLATQYDRPVGDDPVSAALWAAHQARLREQLGDLRVGAPRSALLKSDPYALRAGLLLSLTVAAVIAGPEAPQRLGAALRPDLSAWRGPPASLDLWLTPPAYVDATPILLSQRPNGEAVAVPTGSTLTAMVNGGNGAPSLLLGPSAAPVATPFTAAGESAWRLTAPIDVAGDLAVSQNGRDLGRWPLQLIADLPPSAAFKDAPTATPRRALRFGYAAADDYGVTALRLVLRRPAATADAAKDPAKDPAEPTAIPILPGRRDLTGTATLDLTAHPWAGLPAQLQLIATDAARQDGASDWIDFVLPERLFRHPVARAIIAARRDLIAEPADRTPVIAALGAVAERPAAYNHDAVVFLNLIAARKRLALRAKDPEAAAEVQAQLWELAIRLEEGEAGGRERELRAAEQALRDALARNAPDAEIERLIAEMQAALDRYLAALAQQPPGERRPPNANAQIVRRDDLQKLLDKARELSRQGQRDAAQALLDQLRETMERLQNAPPSADGDGDAGEESASPEREALQNLQSLARRQRDLMDRALRAQQNRRAAPESSLSEEQQALRDALGEVMRKLGEQGAEIPNALGQAEHAMRQAQEQLGRNQPGRAAAPQGEALERMRDAARALAGRLGRREGGRDGQPNAGPGAGPPNPGVDPLGRPAARSGPNGADKVAIPDDNQVRRARDILDELRRRAADPDRPGLERDYLDRLLKRF